MIDLVFRRRLITFGLTVNTERHLRGVRVRTDGSKLLKIQSDEVFGTDRCISFLLSNNSWKNEVVVKKAWQKTSDVFGDSACVREKSVHRPMNPPNQSRAVVMVGRTGCY